MTHPELQQADEEMQCAFLVFSPGGGFCMAHVGDEAEFYAGKHAGTLRGFVLKIPVYDDYREYPS